MEYRVIVQEYENTEFCFKLYFGDVFEESELPEPDMIANMINCGIVEPKDKPQTREIPPKSKGK